MHTHIIDKFLNFLAVKHAQGSNAPRSYITAIEKTNEALIRHGLFLMPGEDIWGILNTDRLQELYELIKQEQHKGLQGIFKEETSSSYYRKHWCSAAIKCFIEYIKAEKEYATTTNSEQDAHKCATALSKLAENIIGKDKNAQVKIRANQYIFRKIVLDNFKHRCCITGLNIPEVLRASHILPWAEDHTNRLNPQNGLCLSATFDAAFDKHLISLDEDFRLVFAPSLKEYYTQDSFRQVFRPYEGKAIAAPVKYLPCQSFLQKHREQLI